MILYNYLFYCSYKMGMRSNNFIGLPVLAGMTMIVPNAAIHIAILGALLKYMGFTWPDRLLEEKIWGRVAYISIFVCMYWYYAYKGRYKRIVEKYNLRKDSYWKRHPFITIVVYFTISLIMMIFVGIFIKNNFFIFMK